MRRCDSFKLGMVKHPEVAASLGGRMYDCVLCFTPGSRNAAVKQSSVEKGLATAQV